MNGNILTVREIREQDIEQIAHYWLDADPVFLKGMGVDLEKVPSKEQLTQMLLNQVNTPIENKRAYCIIWELDGMAVGHSNTNPTIYGEEATMHLHLWNAGSRMKGLGTSFVKMSIPVFFENLKLKRLVCEPYALNPAPNKTLEKTGFDFIREYITIPGSLNFEQQVKRWEMSREKYRSIFI